LAEGLLVGCVAGRVAPIACNDDSSPAETGCVAPRAPTNAPAQTNAGSTHNGKHRFIRQSLSELIQRH
jgi:hypothetical protein